MNSTAKRKNKERPLFPQKIHERSHTHCKTMVQKYYIICTNIFQGAVMDFLERRKII